MSGLPEEDRALLHLSQKGDADAFGSLYERNAPAVFRYLYAHLDNRLDAEDLTSEVFLKTWQSLPTYHERGVPFLAFLFRVARNTLIDYYRRNRAASELSADADVLLSDTSPGPAEMLSHKLEHQEVRRVLRQLREDYRTVLALRFISALTVEETAQVMRRSAGAVRVLQHRALAALRTLIEPGDDPPARTQTAQEQE